MTATLDGSRRSSHRPTLDDSYYFHQSLSDLMKFSESPRSRSSLKSKDTTSDDSLNQSLRKAITRASTHSLITVKSGSDDDENYVPRIWSGTSVEKVPGVAFTRSLGDVVAHEIGVSEVPDFMQMTVQDDDVIVIASDGVTECKLCVEYIAQCFKKADHQLNISSSNIFFCFISTQTSIPRLLSRL